MLGAPSQLLGTVLHTNLAAVPVSRVSICSLPPAAHVTVLTLQTMKRSHG